uniref:probable E3 ubiquitin-protein ligase RHG1A n=1 Tax=Erigeron canadensis TaxID=72917 RepID=UPI001CB93172|nr:probable E3 ubiquitin-protein ligase RHG1A [Erigeron canadensis]
MQGQRGGAIGSLSDSVVFEHGSTSSPVVDPQICWDNMQNASSNQLSDYISLDSSEEEGENENLWDLGEPSSSSGPDQMNPTHTEPRPERGWPTLMKSSIEQPSSVLSLGDNGSSSSTFSDPFGPSSHRFELDDRRFSRKRKAVELSIGQSSSGVGSSNTFQRHEGGSSPWHTIGENPPFDPTIPRLGLNVSTVSSDNQSENPHRNVNPRISSSHQEANPLPINNNNQETDIAGHYSSLRLNPTSEVPSSHQGQPVLRIPSLRRNLQSTQRWTRHTASRANRSSNLVISGDRNGLDSISNRPLFAPQNNIQDGAETELEWNPNGVGDGAVNTTAQGGASSSRSGPSSGPSSHYHPRRLSAYLRRSLLSAADSETSGGQTGNLLPRIPTVLRSLSSSQDSGSPPVAGIQGHHHQPHSRSSLLLSRHLDGALRFPHLSRSTTPGSEGRGRLVSEIRSVLDLMRRGEPLRFEDLMLLDQSVFYGIADIHDRHRDMRLDIDNMSYEELLALEERIGNVNTGLTEETILKHLKQKQYVLPEASLAAEPCCICQEEYKDGDDLGTLECGHDFHHGCVKQWLQQKNSCPICKSTGFTNT